MSQSAPDPSSTVVIPEAASDCTADPLSAVAIRVAEKLEQTEIEALVQAVERLGQVPRDIDAQLLGGARAEVGRDLNPLEKREIRRRFIERCRERMA